MSGDFAQTPGTGQSDYYGIDPDGFTQKTGENLYGQPAENVFQRGNDASMSWMLPSSNPGSMMSQYLNDFGGLTGAVTDATAPLSQQLNDQMQRNVQQNTTNIGAQMSGLGGLRSSGMADVAGRMAGDEAAKAGSSLAQAQLGLLQPLANQQMLGRQYATSEMMKQPMQMMGYQSQFGSPSYAAPEYYQQPGALDWMNSIGNMASGIGSLIPI